ncbi:TPA: ankyrin repeat domain-containing protein [Proteus mirabilis]
MKENNIDIYKIIKDENVEKLSEYLKDLNLSEIKFDKSLLHRFSEEGKYLLCDFIINKGFNTNVIDSSYLTPLVEVAFEGYINILTLLLNNKAWVDGDPRGITTPLIEASCGGHLDIIKLLIKSGADINRLQMNFNRTALDLAISYGHTDVAQYLQSMGGRKAFEEMQAGIIEGDGILSHIYKNVGPILTDEYCSDNIRLMTSWVGNGNYHKLFFTFGNFKRLPHTEFLICLPYNWPINRAIFQSDYKDNFPMKLLSSLSEYYKKSEVIKEGFILDKNDEQWKHLHWPDEIDALVTVDYSFDHQEKEISIPEDEEVNLLLLIPMKYTKTGKPDGEKLEKWLKRKRTASWKSISFKNDWLSDK